VPIRVSAFHGAGVLDKLKGLFSPPSNRIFDETLRTGCPICHATFAIFPHDRNDPKNADYAGQMLTLIAEDCNDGKHCAELTVSD
jgi:hypothetical protein